MDSHSSNPDKDRPCPPCKRRKTCNLNVINIEDELECMICLDFAISPIQSCPNGHIVCGLCFDKVKICGCCQEILGPCGFADRLAAKYYDMEIPCKNSDYGCKLSFKSTAMYDHLSVCEYRAIACFETNVVDCDGKLYEYPEFFDHLKTAHHCMLLSPVRPDSPGTFHKPCFSQNIIRDSKNTEGTQEPAVSTKAGHFTNGLYDCTVDGGQWPVTCFKFDDKLFMMHMTCKNSGIFWYFATTAAAEQYVCKTSIVSTDPQANQTENSWVIPVLPFHETGDQFGNLEAKGFYASIHAQALKLLCRKGVYREIDGTTTNFRESFVTTIEMRKVQT